MKVTIFNLTSVSVQLVCNVEAVIIRLHLMNSLLLCEINDLIEDEGLNKSLMCVIREIEVVFCQMMIRMLEINDMLTLSTYQHLVNQIKTNDVHDD